MANNRITNKDPDGQDLVSGSGDQKAIKSALKEIASHPGGREFLTKMDKLTAQHDEFQFFQLPNSEEGATQGIDDILNTKVDKNLQKTEDRRSVRGRSAQTESSANAYADTTTTGKERT